MTVKHVCVQPHQWLLTWPDLPVFAAARWRLKKTSIDDWYAGASSYRSISVAEARRSAAKPPAAVVAADQWDRQTAGRVDGRPNVAQTLQRMRCGQRE